MSSLYWDVARRKLAFLYRPFGKTYQSRHEQLTNLSHAATQKIEDHNFNAAEA
jgi:hypothetical protein